MNTAKKAALIFLSVIDIIAIAAGITAQVIMATDGDFSSILPIKTSMTADGILLLNFSVLIAVTLLINIITVYLAADAAYSPVEIMSNCAGIFMIIPVLVFAAAVYNAVTADVGSDRLWIILSGLFFVAVCAVNCGCTLTIRYDCDE